MNKKIHSGMMLTVLLVGILTLVFSIQPVKSEPKTWYVDDDGEADFFKIQDAINTASSEDTIYVYDGTYYENVVVNKTLSLIGENMSMTTIDGNGIGPVVCVTASNVILNGFTLQNAGGWWEWACGVFIYHSHNTTVKNNKITLDWLGISLYESSNNKIIGNVITENNLDGIYVFNASNNLITENMISKNAGGFFLNCSTSNIIVNNAALDNSWYGLVFCCSKTNIFVGNIISDSNRAIAMTSSPIWGFSNNNLIYHNNFINNTSQVSIYNSVDNIWDNGMEGNYWSDYENRYPNAVEIDDSGIWDTPYVIDENNQDNYPLMETWAPTPPIPTTIDELKTEIEELGLEGEIDSQGIVTSLLAKLNATQKLVDKGKIAEAKSILEEDFIPQVQNLVNIHITQDAADILMDSAEYIFSNL